MNEFDIEQKNAFEEYYNKIIANSNISNITENYISEKGYLINDLISDVKESNIKKSSELKSNKRDLNLVSEITDLNNKVETLMSKYISPLDKHIPKDKFIFDQNFNDNLYSREKENGSNYIVSQLKEPNLKQGVKYGKFKFKGFKTEETLEKNKNI